MKTKTQNSQKRKCHPDFSYFFGGDQAFSGKIGALRWSILVRKQKHNVQKPTNSRLIIVSLCHTHSSQAYAHLT